MRLLTEIWDGIIPGRLIFSAVCLFAFMGIVPVSPPETAAQGQVAIVAHLDVPVDNLSFTQVRKIFRGEQQFWSNRQRITLLMRAPDAHERDVVLERIYEMTEGQFRQYWIAKIFRSEVASGPKIVYSTEMAHELVTALPGSISFVLASELQDGVKVLRIDGKKPGDPDYPL